MIRNLVPVFALGLAVTACGANTASESPRAATAPAAVEQAAGPPGDPVVTVFSSPT
jgi:hypothetical protein